ncbi:MAG: site-specific DNA-methyltransferase [Nitrospirae bacterium]|nr:site-specific DNA-methyltransferase [Nitrospirota bacterium]
MDQFYIIHEGNCKDILEDVSLFPDNSVDLIFTSPPYSDRRKTTYGGIHPAEYVSWFLPISEQLKRVLKPKGSFILNIKEHVNNGERLTYVIELILALREKGWCWIEEYCWYKKNSYPGKWPNRFRDSWERCLHFTLQKKFKMYQDAVKVPIGDWSKKRFKSMSEKDFIRTFSGTNAHFGRNVSNWLKRKKVYPHNVVVFEGEHYIETTNVVQLATECHNRNHSAAFPVELPTWFIKLFTKKGNVVLDPFMGIGTTATACLLSKRNFIGIELQKEYINEAKQNIESLRKLIAFNNK